MELFQKNMTALNAHYVRLPQKMKEIDIEQVAKRIGVRETPLGNEILIMEKNGRLWNLNSRLDPETVAIIYAESCQIKKFGIYMVFGFMDGRHIRNILKKCDETNKVIVCVPDVEVFYAACCQFDIRDLIEDKRLMLFLPEINEGIDEILKEQIDYTNSKLVDFFILPGQDVLYHEQCTCFMEQVLEVMRDIVVMKSTRETFNRKIPQHTLFHMKQMLRYSNYEQLRRTLVEEKALDLPVIIVSAGPSLDKNIHELKLAQGKAFIIVVDAALRSVLRAGIRPDMVCTVDPNVPNRFYEGVDLSNIIWSCTANTRPDIVSKYGKKIFYYGYFCKYWSEELKSALGYDFPDIVSGGSVSIEAFMLAHYLGFKKIILIGQDLAFTGGKSHTKGVGDALGNNDEYINSRCLMQVEGIDGTMLETDFQMFYYKQWFEKVFEKYKDELEVIDATEGGALLKGTTLRTLKEVIETECKRSVDIYQMALEIPQMFSEEEQKVMLEKACALKEMVLRFKERVMTDIESQKKLLKMARTKHVSTGMISSELKRMMRQSELLKRELLMDMVIQYAAKEEYEFGDNIYAKEDMSIKELVQQSIHLYEGYLDGCEMLLEDIETFIMQDGV